MNERPRRAKGFPVLKITSPDAYGSSASVTLDGVPLTTASQIVLHVDAADITRATITIMANVDVELPAKVTLRQPIGRRRETK